MCICSISGRERYVYTKTTAALYISMRSSLGFLGGFAHSALPHFPFRQHLGRTFSFESTWEFLALIPTFEIMIPLPATDIGNGEDLEGFAGAGLFESVCAEEAGNLSWELWLVQRCLLQQLTFHTL